jgi:hypothetical protein
VNEELHGCESGSEVGIQGTRTVPSSASGKCGFQQTSHKWPSGSAW